MAFEQQLQQLEDQNAKIVKQNQHIKLKTKRLTAARTLMAVAICAVVTLRLQVIRTAISIL